MQTIAAWIAVLFGLIAVVAWMAYSLGKGNAEKKQAKSETERLAENADIASHPFVDDPVSSMCKED